MTRRRAAVLLLIAPLVAAWVYAGVRASSVAFTYDESLTYGIIHGNRTFLHDANNHWLNTFAMRVTQHLFGQSEFALRLPNVLGFGVYGAAVLVILWRRRPAAQVAGLLLLIVNPFLLEFFGLARGYGLGLAFVAVAVAAAVTEGPELLRLATVVVAGALAFYASFGALNVVLAAYGVVAMTLIRHRWGNWRYIASGVGLLTAGLVAMTPGFVHLKEMQDAGMLYLGGHQGFIPDTIGSVLWFSAGGGPEPGWLPLMEGVVVAVALACGVRAIWRRRWDMAAGATALFFLAVAAQVVESTFFHTLWPEDRVALCYVIPFAAMVVLAIDGLKSPTIAWAPTAIASVVIVGNFLAVANVSSTTLWRFDETSRAVMKAVASFEAQAGRPTRPWRLLTGFPREQALEYYRLRDHMTYVLPMTRDPVTEVGDLYYVDSWQPWVPDTVLVATFPATRTELRARSVAVTGPKRSAHP